MLVHRLAIALTALTHTLFATFVVGATLIGALCESVGVLTKDDRYERLSHSIARTLVLMSAAVSFLGVVLVLFLTILWPSFWTTLFRIMFWPLILEASFFLGEAICLYSWYYSWGRWPRKVHLLIAWLGAGFSWIAMVMIDIVGSYLLTPRPPLDTVRKIINPSMVQLDLHRFAGNLAWSGFAIAALSAIRYLRARDSNERAYQEWAGAFCVTLAFGFLLLMPILGHSYMKAVRFVSEEAFVRLMLAEKSWVFILQVFLIDLLFLVGSWYMFRMARFHFKERRSFIRYRRLATLLMAGAAILFVIPYHVQQIPFAHYFTSAQINPWGVMAPNKYIAMWALFVIGIINYMIYLDAFRFRTEWGTGGKVPQVLLLGLALFTIFSMLNMGYARENGRYPYLIYKKMTLQQEEIGAAVPLQEARLQEDENKTGNDPDQERGEPGRFSETRPSLKGARPAAKIEIQEGPIR